MLFFLLDGKLCVYNNNNLIISAHHNESIRTNALKVTSYFLFAVFYNCSSPKLKLPKNRSLSNTSQNSISKNISITMICIGSIVLFP